MVVVLRKERKSRLSAMIDQAGGISVGVALAQARAHLETLQAQSQAIVGERVAELAALKPPPPTRPTPGRCWSTSMIWPAPSSMRRDRSS